VLRSGIVLVALFATGMIFDDIFVAFMVKPWELARQSLIDGGLADPGRLGFIKPTEGFLFSMKVSISFAVLLGAPYFLSQLWRFIGVGLHAHERKAVFKALPAAIALFAGGLVFGFRVVMPLALPILLTWIAPELANSAVTLQEYLGLLLTLTLLLGVVFELPILMWLAVRAGLIDAAKLASSRRLAILIMLISDPVTQLLVALPMAVLYEFGLVLARRAQAARERAVL